MKEAVELFIGDDTNNRRFRVKADSPKEVIDLLKERGINLDIYRRINITPEGGFYIVDCEP